MPQNRSRPLIWFCLAVLLAGCMPHINQPGPALFPAQLLNNRYLTTDGTLLPLREWQPSDRQPQAVIIAVHGFNDYSHFFQQPGEFFSQHQIACYAYDQRGFGGSPQRGLWGGIAAYHNDLGEFIRLIQIKHPKRPIYLLGESMGAAVAILAMTQASKPNVTGILLSAPAVWGKSTMPWYQKILLTSLAYTVPWLTLTGKGLKIQASDNIPMLKALSQDPLVIKATRVETLYGLADLMDAASQQAAHISDNTLVLYGNHDQIIPPQSITQFIQYLQGSQAPQKTIAYYQNGYHMLLRDLNAPTVWQDILMWMRSTAPIPSLLADR